MRRLIDAFTFEIDTLAERTAGELAQHPGYRAVQAIPGVGPVLATVFVAEVGDVTRFPGSQQLCSWAGMTPSHRESDTKVHRRRITKQGNHLVRWAAIEAVQRLTGGAIGRVRARLTDRRGANIAKVAAARKLLTLVFLLAARRARPLLGPTGVSIVPAQSGRAVGAGLPPTGGT